MSNLNIQNLNPYPFTYLSNLLKDSKPGDNKIIDLSIGEPKNSPPQEVITLLNDNSPKFSQYPTSFGISKLRSSYSEWLSSRFNLKTPIDPEKNVLPLGGTREGIFSFFQANIDSSKKHPMTVIPNPFYKIYEGASVAAGASCFYINQLKENNFSPDFDSIPNHVWENCQLLMLCSPSNPTGQCLNLGEYKKALLLADKFNFLVCSDECYTDIYPSKNQAPIGLLQASEELGLFSRSVIFHSLSKRSSLAGLRSGFVCAHEDVIEKFLLYRTYHGVTLPLPTQEASTWAWSNKEHVEKNRISYDKKYDNALTKLQNFKDIKRPDGSFYLWIETPMDDQVFTKRLYVEKGLITLPGSYLGTLDQGLNPGTGFIRVAIVHNKEIISEGMERLAEFLSTC